MKNKTNKQWLSDGIVTEKPQNHKLSQLSASISKVIGISALGIQLAHGAGALQFTVDSTADQPEAGLTTFREAVAQANAVSGAEIIFDDQVFNAAQTITLQNGEITISSSVFVDGPGADLLTIDGNDASRILRVSNSDSVIDVQLSGLTLTNGNGVALDRNGQGGCLFSREKLTLNNSVITGCRAGKGGGITAIGNNGLTIRNSTISDNAIGNGKGGGLYHDTGRDTLITGSTFSGNSGGFGGAIYTARTNGFEIVNTTISGNVSNNDTGGGIFSSNDLTIENSTIAYNQGTGLISPRTVMSNTIIVNNTLDDCDFRDTGSVNLNNLDTDGSCDVDAVNHITVSEPFLEPLASFGGPTLTHRPLFFSPAVDQGDDLLCAAVDQRGTSRPQDRCGFPNPICDIGAVELTSAEEVPLVVIFNDGFDGLTNTFEVFSEQQNRGCR